MDDKKLAVVDNIEIRKSDLDRIIEKYPVNKRIFFETEQGMNQLLEQKIAFMLMSRYAKEKEFDKTEDFGKKFEELTEQLLTQIVMAKMFAEINISKEDIKKSYKDNIEKFIEGKTVTARHILVEKEGDIIKIKKEIEDGEILFEDAAKKYSMCPSKEREGSLGIIKRGMMVTEFEEIAFNLELNVLSEPVKTQFGYHLIKVEEKTEPYTMSFQEVKDKIRDQLLAQKQQEKYEEHINELKKRYKVEII